MTPFARLIASASASAGGYRPLARRLGLSPMTVQRWAVGAAEPSLEQQRQIALALTPPADRTPAQHLHILALAWESIEEELARLADQPGEAGDAYAHALAIVRGEVEA
jgi:transcriptional regulator with XRE-family HTH domain